MACDSLAHGVSEKTLPKKQKLSIPPKTGARHIINMKLSWGDNPEINVMVMVNPGSNVPVLSQSLVGDYKVAVVLRERAEITTGFDGAVGKVAGSAHSFACTLSLAERHTKECL